MRRLVSGPRKLDFEFLLPAKDAATLVELSGIASLNSSAHITNHVTPQQHSWVSEHRDEDDVVPALESLCAERTAKVALPPKCSGSQGSLDRSQKAPPSQGQPKATKGRQQTLQAREATRGSS